MSKTALITGITGQDGYYLSKFLIEKGYEVHGTIRRSSTFNKSRIDSLMAKYDGTGKLNLYYSDLLDSSSLSNLVSLIQDLGDAGVVGLISIAIIIYLWNKSSK